LRVNLLPIRPALEPILRGTNRGGELVEKPSAVKTASASCVTEVRLPFRPALEPILRGTNGDDEPVERRRAEGLRVHHEFAVAQAGPRRRAAAPAARIAPPRSGSRWNRSSTA
jgi:hypothetical protein